MKYILLCLSLCFCIARAIALPNGFVYLSDIDPSILQEIRYSTHNNFLGRSAKGYKASRCILTKEAAAALSAIQKKLQARSLSLQVYDCYRPQMAVDDFFEWSQGLQIEPMKPLYYPNIDKEDFFKLGYAARKSSHTRGSTVDLTVVLISKHDKIIPLRMGTHFDYMDPASHTSSSSISKIAKFNRFILRDLMLKMGFKPTANEWWHFTLQEEPFPTTYFNFSVE